MNGATMKLTGGAAIGAALAVIYTHGFEYTVQEIMALGAGFGAIASYAGHLGDVLFGRLQPGPKPGTVPDTKNEGN